MVKTDVFCDKCGKDITNEGIHIISSGMYGDAHPRVIFHLCLDHYTAVVRAIEEIFKGEAHE